MPSIAQYKRIAIIAATVLNMTVACPSFASSTGAPVCEVATLPLLAMSNFVVNPPPTGWTLQVDRLIFVPGQPMQIRVRNNNPIKNVKGVLLWAKQNSTTGAGNFIPPVSGLFRFAGDSVGLCGEWAITHNTAASKTQADLVFDWMPPADGTTFMRAFVIEDCGLVGGCRAWQALTQILVLQPALFVDGFE
jgi:Reeler domain